MRGVSTIAGYRSGEKYAPIDYAKISFCSYLSELLHIIYYTFF
jgi:hypothetical protein